MQQDFKELLSAFSARSVEYLVVGAHALAAHGYVRATKDFDVWVRPEADNARRTFHALGDFGAPLHELREADLATPGLIFQIGVPPIRIDIITSIEGVEFADAWRDRVHAKFGGVPAAVLSVAHLIANKSAAGRDQDLVDVRRLKELQRAVK